MNYVYLCGAVFLTGQSLRIQPPRSAGLFFIDAFSRCHDYDKKAMENLAETVGKNLACLRKAKGMTEEAAKEALLTNPLMFGVMMVKMGDADGMVSGACHATAI